MEKKIFFTLLSCLTAAMLIQIKPLYAEANYLNQEILDDISLSPKLSLSSFWKQSLEQFLDANSHIEWSKEEENDNQVTLTVTNLQNFSIWTLHPTSVKIAFKNNTPDQLIINIWNKGDSKPNDYIKTSNICRKTRRKLKDAGIKPTKTKQKLNSVVSYKWENYKMEETILSFCIKKKEYIMLRLKSSKITNTKKEKKINKAEWEAKLKKNVKFGKNQNEGDVFIYDIPMLNQKGKGYCAPATFARVLLYYGIEVDMHLLADLMDTKEGTGGTSLKKMEQSLNQLCKGLPFSYKKIPSFSPRSIKKYIDRGIPLVWLIPDHLRLIIGYNKEKKEIIYSDTWGYWHKYKKMPNKEANRITKKIYVLE